MFYYRCLIRDDYYYLVTNNDDLVFVGSPNKNIDEIYNFLGKVNLIESYDKVKKYSQKLYEYFINQKEISNIKIPEGTEFQKLVWAAVRSIPYGETRTYSDIARQLDKPKAVRAVATAIGENPLLIFIPCHRVLGKNGNLCGYRGGLELKQKLLEMEKVYKK
ncbi:methylated-DNA--[protein]-cysteine S-methyltransferase [Gemella bergeri]|uniref:methylated-DNA--[protein]-cysteine S-methyltransferase n=1 Tax=Gemella bergeri TaxID=84136 RepID=UPI000420C6EE|nr:methylated-DNA--[protein]-cysteine S-methyltransferase [Gemella bergeri]